jgi:hypothetical protein
MLPPHRPPPPNGSRSQKWVSPLPIPTTGPLVIFLQLMMVIDILTYQPTEVLNDNCGHYTFTIPKDIAPGDYLLRAEVIALHVASSVGGAQ